jgi:hypothetical protein
MFWRRKPAYVEWDLVGNESSGFGADIYRSAAPMVIVHQIDADYRTYRSVASAVEQWVALAPEKYRLNEEFEEFKALAHELDEGKP